VYHFGTAKELAMKRRAVIALAALLPLAGCATPYGYSPGAWAYYDGDYDSGQEGYDRPIIYYGESAQGLPYDNSSYGAPASGQVYGNVYSGAPVYAQSYAYDGDQAYSEPDSDGHAKLRHMSRCHCRPAHATPPAQHDPAWYSTYYTIG
jgi:hypothetical protein